MFRKLTLTLACLIVGTGLVMSEAPATQQQQRSLARKQLEAGNFRDAFEIYRKLATDSENATLAGEDLQAAAQCLNRLGRIDEFDELLAQTAELHAQHPRVLADAAQALFDVPHNGFLIAGEFHRGHHRGGGNYVSSFERDRVRILQLMEQARANWNQEQLGQQQSFEFYRDYARFLLAGRDGNNAWKLQVLTDLSQLPEFDEQAHFPRWGTFGGASSGAPVDAEGNPVFHHVPESFAAAKSDGERWRWMLQQAIETDQSRAGEIRLEFANFLWQQFGVQTMAHDRLLFAAETGEGPKQSGPYAVHTLEENETIARLATGARRLTLPDEFNFLRIYKELGETGPAGVGDEALERLAQIFENRRQYPRAAEFWKACIQKFGPGDNNNRRDRLQQIVGNWGRFQDGSVQPAGTGATVDFRFRNGQRVSFEARRIDIDLLLDDVKAYLKSNPQQLDYQRVQIDQIGYRLVRNNETKYLGERAAAWDLELEPPENHVDRRITVTTPLQQPGAYLLTGRMAEGNTSRIIIWVADTVIVRKPLEDKSWYYLADALTGKPVAGANVEFFGFRHRRLENRNVITETRNFAERSDENGQVILDPNRPNDNDQDYQWLATARGPDGRFAYTGFEGVWSGGRIDRDYPREAPKAYVITDRPVYRPEQTVEFKVWLRKASYLSRDDQDAGDAEFAHRDLGLVINDPEGNTVLQQTFRTDEFGGISGKFVLPADTRLGQYSIQLADEDQAKRLGVPHVGAQGGGHFRVEEYKKPEYEVTVTAPDEPIALGEKFTATIAANYYFGAPVTSAVVNYKVERTPHTHRWFPRMPWDWLYGNGYWWFSSDYDWYPGWARWGTARPAALWWPVRHDPPELVAQAQVPIGPDGTVSVEIDSTLAKQLHGDTDHKYTITAEVVDQSRRTIVGTGSVLATREPFDVTLWTHRGYYRQGDTVEVSVCAQTAADKPVAGTAELTLYRITYNEQAEPVETAVQTWELSTNDEGRLTHQLSASEAGQYRLSCKVTDAEGRTVDGAVMLIVRGAGFDGQEFRFNDLELITDKRDYQPGETVRLMINTNRTGSTVALFLRPEGGTYRPPVFLTLGGKSTVYEIPVDQGDRPNFFVEALTISGGQLHSETRELYVPPEQRIVNVEVQPSQEEYRPGTPADVQLKLTDIDGNPFQGSLVLTMYDRSVEYISGGSNVENIQEFFWNWKRHHHPATNSTLDRRFGNLLKQRETPMRDLGIFGDQLEAAEGLRFNRGGAVQLGRTAAPAPAAAPMEMKSALALGDASSGAAESLVQPTVRTEFADTAYWNASLTSNAEGLAQVSLTMPENLTEWKLRAWALGAGTAVGEGEASVVTSKNLIVRLQAPRFFVETDEVVLSANVHNYLETTKQAKVVLELDGSTLSPLDEVEQTVEIPAGGEARVDWRVKVTGSGEALIRMQALTDEESDAVEMHFPVYVHGMLKTESFAGVIRPNDNAAQIEITVPDQRRPEESRLEIRYSPTLAGAMVDALPYLITYPYGCTEQTLNRFLPALITQKVLKSMDLDLAEIRDKRTNLNPQEIGEPAERAEQWQRYKSNPVFDEAELDRIVSAGLEALTEMQLPDGSWGWFSGRGERSDPHMTALVVHGLQVARQNGAALVPDVLAKGVAWLTRYQAEQVERLKNAEDRGDDDKRPWKPKADNLDAFVFMVLVDAGVKNDAMFGYLERDRVELTVYAKSLYGLALHKLGEADKLAAVMRNIDQFLVEDNENQTAYLKLPGSFWWFWYGDDIEANANYLKLLVRTNPESPKASGLVKYLLNNRKHGSRWNSTRDTALCVEALAEYMRATGENKPDMTVQVVIDGDVQKEVRITPETLFSFDGTLVLAGEAVTSGKHTIEFRKQGQGPLYFNAYLTNFTLEDPITSAGLEVQVQRRFYRLIEQDAEASVAGSRGQALDQRVVRYKREELPNLATLNSGELVEIELEIESKNDYEYLMFEDMKVSGTEPVDLRSGYNGNDLGAYMELRDERVVFFVRRLARGKHSVSYRLRAEIPGRFSALPAKAAGMYAPELRANSDEFKLRIIDESE